MISTEIRITNARGLHARAAALLTKTAAAFRSRITVARAGARADAREILALMLLAAAHGTTVTVSADGVDEHLAVQAVENLIANGFHER